VVDQKTLLSYSKISSIWFIIFFFSYDIDCDPHTFMSHCIHQVRGHPPERVLMLPDMFQTKPIRKVLLVGSGGLSIGQAGIVVNQFI
jgi:hypothetical protein